MKGRLVLHEKITDDLGNTVEMKIWQVPDSADKPHGYKTPWSYIVGGDRVVGYDNAEEKGTTGISWRRNPPIRSGACAAWSGISRRTSSSTREIP